MKDLEINSRVIIPAIQLETTHARSSGPGGQNVNKVNSKVVLAWQIAGNTLLPSDWTNRAINKHRNRINGDGKIQVTSQQYREQYRNLGACLSKLRELLLECQYPPKKRLASRPTLGSKKRRTEAKRQNSKKKQDRRQKWD